MDSLHNYSPELINKYGVKHIPIIENIWGHRFRSDQTPALLFFELLCVIESQLQAKKHGLIENIFSPSNTTLYFKHRQFFKLRILLYQNEILETLESSDLTDSEKWEKQFEYLTSIKNDLFSFNEEDINHIRVNFSSFESFYNAIKILCSLTFDPLSKKRWSSKFIYPISIDYVWCDFDNKNGTEDRRFFARGGELVYLMLCRAGDDTKARLESCFEEWLGEGENAFTKLANLLVRKEERIPLSEQKRKELGFLPYTALDIFDNFGRDISGIMSLDLEKLDKIKVMIDMVGFHVGNYIYSIGDTYSNQSNPKELRRPFYIVEVMSKVTNSIRKTSIQSISTQRNNLKRSLALVKDNIFRLYEDYLNTDDLSEPERLKLIKEELSAAESYLANHISNYPNICFREIGLLSKKNTRSYRYVLTEDFLHSLVVTILGNDKRLEFKTFINELKSRYFIFVDIPPNNSFELIQRDLNRNVKNLASLLYQMGMLRHLSDACSYVINPYKEDSV
ncbi:hypothetical protein [Thalassotalea maritima]|uniref:hypothetical protein n=1 Tax=Thalassotalea maritima TaxID=3242416 RepID=UPI003528B8C0